ncbi:hypothetical protein E0Z06_00670 [Rheinheimera sp. D18]|uniref:putative metalloprotease CJM1_0395 family protein n=1 Tax=Rheinheimera sp. D18 TaxID=2545632 RepID=UPI00104A7ADD|nr:putative metalloprotease CJM1_0395 family protein [Rheinheimera sp. D18]QBL08125.1 hypothetical protein E0Z06_00670 [Rheinheimera sp. D18]
MLVSNYPNVSINTANPPTEMARSDSLRQNLFTPVKQVEKSGAEKPVVSDDKPRSSSNSSSTGGLYDAKGKETETQQAIDGRGEREPDPEQQGDDAKREEEQAAQRDTQQQQAEQQEQQKIQQLKSRDQEVKIHEQAHAALGGSHAGSPSYSYELGPDGKRYAVDGEVQIDISPIPGDPQATIQKMQQVRAAALAPGEPSSADRRIAVQAAQQQTQAQAELVKQTSSMGKGLPEIEQDSGSDSAANMADDDAQSDITLKSQVRQTLAMPTQMQVRNGVIASFYQRATEPLVRQSLHQV